MDSLKDFPTVKMMARHSERQTLTATQTVKRMEIRLVRRMLMVIGRDYRKEKCWEKWMEKLMEISKNPWMG